MTYNAKAILIEIILIVVSVIVTITIFSGCNKNLICCEDDEIIKGQIIYDGYGAWDLNLPYEINSEVEDVFAEWIHFAIDILNITVDGKELPVNFSYTIAEYDPRSVFKYELIKVEEKKQYFISMRWRRIGVEGIYWDDCTVGASIHSRAYYIPKKNKKLHITYRIILPYPTLTPRNLFDKDYEYKKYSKEYKMCVDLKELFNSSYFKYP